MKKTKVVLIKTENYDHELVIKSVRKALDLLGGIRQFKETYGKKVLLKPNILGKNDPEKAVTTHPTVVEAAIIIFKENGFHVTVGDSPAIESTKSAAQKSGILKVCEKHGIELADFSIPTEADCPEGSVVKHFTVAKATRDADFIVTMPKLKTHSQMYYTGAVKNIFGTVPGMKKSKFHMQFIERNNFAKMIIDLNVLQKPALAIMDGITAMEGPGPQDGFPRHLGLIGVSLDPLALDVVCSRIIGYNPENIPILKEGLARKNFYIDSASEIEIAGDDEKEFKCPDFKKVEIVSDIAFIRDKIPAPIYNFLRNAFIPRPFFDGKRCIRCGKCIKICSVSALDFIQKDTIKFISIDYSKCIRCYCCHEVCPAKAIDLKKKAIGK